MKTISRKTIRKTATEGLFEGMVFEGCTFDNAAIRNRTSPDARPIVRDIVVKDAALMACSLTGVTVDTVSVTNLKAMADMPLFCWACVFRHVVLAGKITTIKINRRLLITGTDAVSREQAQAPWDDFAREYYKSADWALDLRNAEFTGSITLEAIPGSLVRRDEETQVLISRERLGQSNWQQLDFGSTGLDVAIEWFLDGSLFDDVVLVAEKKRKNFKEKLKVLQELRKEGIAV